jgi:myo-inositol-1(or 4)-monophosphatase
MTNEQWLSAFQGIGRRMRSGIAEFLSREGGKEPIGRGAGGDKTFPVDKWAEDIVLAALEDVHRRGESFTLVSEELGVRAFGVGRKTVLVDPIDGSNNAKNGVPFFATSLALLEGDRLAGLRVGYIINLASGDEFWAAKGGGAFRNGHPIRTPGHGELTIVAYEASDPAKDLPRILPLLAAAKRTRCFGSTALDLALLASQGMSAFVTATPSRAFDYAAGMLILAEAGGVMTDIDGRGLDDIPAGIARTVPLLAAKNAAAHGAALALLKGKRPALY